MSDWINTMASVVLIAVALLAMLSIVFRSWRNGISPMPTSVRVRGTAVAEINRLRKEVKGDLLVEAGSGWGGLALQIAERCPGWRIVGLENSFLPWMMSRFMLLIHRSASNVSFVRGNMYSYSFESASMIVCYLYPGAMLRLAEQWRKQCRPGTFFISICFALPGWEPDKEIICTDLHRTKIFVYKMKEY